jgi:3-(3-hydroxy-phenyl)propionate hydroxylase
VLVTEDQVLIVGAGPAGLTTAALLAEAGVPALVLEAEAELPTNLRASTFHPPTLDMLDRFGVTDKLIAQGLIAPTVQYRDRKAGKIAEFDFGELADVTSRPYRLQCEQYKLNFALLDYIESQKSVSVRFDASVTGVEQTDDWVEASLSDGSSVRGRWLMGADGARSVVREALAIPFEGFTWPEAFLVVSTAFPFEQHMDDLCWVNYFADPEEWFFLLRAPDFWRVMFPTGPDETEAEIFDETRIQARLHRVLPKATPYEIAHTTLYRVHQRVATRYREGRAFLAGDAAHINNPLGGMGMNGGIHDAFNLGEKLVAVMAKGADPAILNQYETERRPVALEYVNEITIRNKRNLETADPAEQAAFRAMLAATAADPAKRRAFLLRASMLASLGVSG